jgi:ABC-type spermidine/putrescine transport system permease subunit II
MRFGRRPNASTAIRNLPFLVWAAAFLIFPCFLVRPFSLRQQRQVANFPSRARIFGVERFSHSTT